MTPNDRTEPGVCQHCGRELFVFVANRPAVCPICPGQQPAQPESGEAVGRFTADYIADVTKELESRGWRPDSRGDADCVDEASAAGADIIRSLQSALTAAQGALDAANQHVQILRVQQEEYGHERTTAQQTIDRMRAKLLELAGECAKCGGSGLVTIRGMCGGVEMDCDDQPCPDCEDIREAAGVRYGEDGE